nr:P-loop NTPase [Paenibacillus oceani]
MRHRGSDLSLLALYISDNNPVEWRGPMLGKMLSAFLYEAAWEPLDVMLIDLPPGTGDIALQVHQKIPQCSELIVTTPSAAASYVAARAGKMAMQANQRIVGVIENMSYYVDPTGEKHYIFGQQGGALLAEQLQTKLLAQIPIAPPKPDSLSPHTLPSVYAPESTNGQLFNKLAEHIIHTNT